jgi:hypothetical protein
LKILTLKYYTFGKKHYELADWLGNIRVLINDKKTPMGSNANDMTYNPQTVSVSSFWPFGNFSAHWRMLYKSYESGYRYGFNGQEKVDEISGTGNHNTALFWEYDTRLGRRWNLDPKPQISISDYSVLGNNPLINTDVLGDTTKILNTKGDLLIQINDKGENRFFEAQDQESFNKFTKTVVEKAKKAELLESLDGLLDNSGFSELKVQGDFSDAYGEPEKHWAKQGYEDGFSGREKIKARFSVIGIKEESKVYQAYEASYYRGRNDKSILYKRSIANKQVPLLILSDAIIIIKESNYFVKYKTNDKGEIERSYFIGYPPIKEFEIPEGTVPR